LKIKSLLVLGAVNPGAIENVFIAGFEKQGVTVDRFDIYDRYITAISGSVVHKILNKISPSHFYRPINKDLLAFLAGKRYDAILVFKGMELFPETLVSIRKHTSVLANYNGDHPFIYFFPGSGNNNVRDGIPHYDVHFSYAKSIVSKLKTEYSKSAFRIPFGYNNNIPVSTSEQDAKYAKNFVFVGAYDQQRAGYLESLRHPLLHIYGDDKWRTRNPHKPFVLNAYQQASLYEQDYMHALRSSQGVINILREQNLIEDSHNMRTFEVPGFGGLLISQRTAEQMEFFEDGREAVFFDSIDELRSKLDHLAKNPDLVKTIKEAGYQRSVSSGYSYDHRSKQLLEYLDQSV
jgi:spore maturation protein CgeB